MIKKIPLVFFLLCAAMAFAQTQDEINGYFDRYNTNVNTGNIAGALAVLDTIIHIDSTRADLFHARASLSEWAENKEVNKIVADYTKAIRLDSTNAGYYFARGNVLWFTLEDKNTRAALSDFRQAVKYDSAFYDAYEKLHTYYIYRDTKEAGKIRKLARHQMHRRLEADTMNAESWFLLGKTYDLLDYGLEKPAIKNKSTYYYSRAIALDSTRADYYWERGTNYGHVHNNYKAAISDMEHAIALDDRAIYHMWVSTSYEHLGDLKKALEAAEEGLRAFPNDWQLQDQKKKLLKPKKKK